MPEKAGSVTPQIADLANQLIEDITSRDLAPGDRYLSTAEASKYLGVSTAAANRALQLLERRRIISRQQRRGAFILGLPDDNQARPLHRVHFLVHPLYMRTEGMGNDQILLGMQSELPGVHVQISFLPQGDETGLVQQLIAQALAADSTDGFVLVRASCETQRLVAGSGLPAVVFGAIYPGIDGLASLDRDQHAVGGVLAKWMLKRGHQRFAYLNRQLVLPGDNITMEAIAGVLAESGKAVDSLLIRGLPSDSQSCVADLHSLLKRPNAPTALICRSLRIAENVEAALGRVGGDTSKYDIAVCDFFSGGNSACRFAYPQPVENDEQQGQHLARLLSAQVEGWSSNARNVIVPVQLKQPIKNSK
ncbi:GntR family transcriptional regulator [Aeoliella sp. ICT_H6.2]|uniref:GntR family transcriptional regulator n=1 Tax=Aeoliella straminimaris TaxID=2954799 RepID=A0A9X2F8I8_9BACT|nr:GntR family transcriptional regulator [Aeoliella straminimaris]MCO6044265.1 GntR family transcriptional regulator [Aeoliella straminimaris]